MPFIADAIFDSGLSYLDTNGTRIDICSTEPSTFTQATSTNTLGNASVNTGAPTNPTTGTGRAAVVPAIANGSVTGTGSATHWALTGGASELLATGTRFR